MRIVQLLVMVPLTFQSVNTSWYKGVVDLRVLCTSPTAHPYGLWLGRALVGEERPDSQYILPSYFLTVNLNRIHPKSQEYIQKTMIQGEIVWGARIRHYLGRNKEELIITCRIKHLKARIPSAFGCLGSYQFLKLLEDWT